MKKIKNRINNFFKYKELFYQLVIKDIKLKYRNSVLGYFWSVLNPLLIMIVKVIVFSNLFERSIPNFPIYLLCRHLLFSFMSGSSTRSLLSIVGNAGLLKKIYVPKYIFTVATVTSDLLTFIFSFGALIILLLFTRTPVSLYSILIIIPIIQLYVFCIGLGLFLSQATVFFRDIQHIWSVFTTAWMFLSAIFYPVDILPDTILYLVTNLNPMYFYITMFREFLMNKPDFYIMADLILRGFISSLLVFLIGYISFTRNKNKFILYM